MTYIKNKDFFLKQVTQFTTQLILFKIILIRKKIIV